jgi:hypothetical protein
MRVRNLFLILLLYAFFEDLSSLAQNPSVPTGQTKDAQNTQAPAPSQKKTAQTQTAPAPTTLDGIIERFTGREKTEIEAIAQYSPLIETYVQEVQPDVELGMVPKTDFYFLGQADFRKQLKVHTLIERSSRGNWLWSFEPAGFLQMIFVDRGEFDKQHYRFKYAGRQFLGDVRCFVLDVTPAPKVRGPRFVGRIWVEDQDYTIVRINGKYAPSIHFSLKTFQDEFHLHFDSWRINVKSGLWLPAYVFSQEIHRPKSFAGPNFKSQTRLWGYKLTPGAREEELSRLLVEPSPSIKDEAQQHDRSPLEEQREWRHEAETNVMDVLERDGLIAPAGPVDTVLNQIVNNLEVTNNLDPQIDFRCRVLMTSSLELFSVENTIVLSRGLIDVVPNEATLAALLAHEMADALQPKAYQDQYGFSDVLRYTPTEVLKHLSFQDEQAEAIDNNARAMELLKKSPYAPDLNKAGLFLSQLQSQAQELKRLINPQLGNQVFFASQLIQAAPPLKPTDKTQIAALPMGSRVKVDPWSDGITLMKTAPTSPISAREKMPFEVTPIIPYLTRYVESSENEATSILPMTENQ